MLRAPRKPNIIVIGDIMLDENNYTHIEKIANEAPIPVFNLEKKEYKLGGCGNVLQNLHSMGCANLYICSVIGNDEYGDKIEQLVRSIDVHNCLKRVAGVRTVTKQRYFSNSKILFRCDIENDAAQKQLIRMALFYDCIREILETTHIDCIIFSDYNKDVLHELQCKQIIDLAVSKGVFTCVDPKNNYIKYKGCTLMKPNRSEAYRLFNLSTTVPLQDVHKEIIQKVGCRYSVITLAEEGITLYDGSTIIHEVPTVHSIVDVTGAGDIVCSILAYFLCLGCDPRSVVHTATKIATRSVEFPGTYIVQPSDFQLTEFAKHSIIEFDQLAFIRRAYSGKTVAFTNGCFDLLHSGHLEVLRFCKSKADVVIVGINTDASVKRLKGESRPVHDQTTRAQIVVSNNVVDHVILFDDATPVNIVKALCPDFLIKGGDYTVDSIVGKEYAKETLVCPFVAGKSTTNTILGFYKPDL